MNAIEMWHKAQAIRLIVKASIINKERYSNIRETQLDTKIQSIISLCLRAICNGPLGL